MTKENLWQIIVGIMVAAICTVTLNMGAFALIPVLVVAIAWAGIKQTSARSTKTPKAIMKNRSFGKTLYR